MAVNTRIALPPGAQLQDVSDVLAFLLGCPIERQDFGGSDPFTVYKSSRVRYVTDHRTPWCCDILIDSPHGTFSFLWHWEFPASEWSGHGMMPYTTPLVIEIGHRLVAFFGGELTERDYTDTIDLRAAPNPLMTAQDGQPYQDWQNLKATVTPLDVPALMSAID